MKNIVFILFILVMTSQVSARTDLGDISNPRTKICAFHGIVYHQYSDVLLINESTLMCPIASQDFINTVTFPEVHDVHNEECYSSWWTN